MRFEFEGQGGEGEEFEDALELRKVFRRRGEVESTADEGDEVEIFFVEF